MTPTQELEELRAEVKQLRADVARLGREATGATVLTEEVRDRIARQENRLDGVLHVLALPGPSRRAILERLLGLLSDDGAPQTRRKTRRAVAKKVA